MLEVDRPARLGGRAAHDAVVRRACDRGHGRCRCSRAGASLSPRRPPYWLLAAAVSFVDGRLIPFPSAIFVVGIAAAFLLGNLRDARRRRGSAWRVVLGGAAIVVAQRSRATPTGEFIFIPLLFAIAWLAGFALRERAEQAEAAELRAALAEREREAAARIAVAEERARIARELHDIVAHAVSVMVLQVGAVRHKLPGDARPRTARRSRTSSGPAGRRSPRCAGCSARCAATATTLELAPQPGLDGLDSLLEEVEPRRAAGRSCTSRASRSRSRAAIDLSAYRIVQEGLTNALKHAHAEPRRRDRPLPARRARRSRSATTASAPSTTTGSATGSSASASASRSTAAR